MEDEPVSKSMSSSMSKAFARFWWDGGYGERGAGLDDLRGIS